MTTYGTAAVASSLHHPFGGKTGTTNDYTDAWFIGFSPSVTAGVWIGFDNRQSLGEKETGAKAALPIWMDFMRAAIDGKDDETFPAEGAPKKHLEVAVTENADKPEVPEATAVPDAPEEPKIAEPPASAASVRSVYPTSAGEYATGCCTAPGRIDAARTKYPPSPGL